MKFPGFETDDDINDAISFSLAGRVADGMFLQRKKDDSDVLTIYFRDGSLLEIKAVGSDLKIKSELLKDREHLERHYGGKGFIKLVD